MIMKVRPLAAAVQNVTVLGFLRGVLVIRLIHASLTGISQK